MKGDYYRYLAEIVTDNERQSNVLNYARKWRFLSILVVEMAEKSRQAYTDGFDMATNQMPVTHPTRLGLALNFSVFHYEILNERDAACRLAKQV